MDPEDITYRWYDGTFTTEDRFKREFGNFPITVGGSPAAQHVSEVQAITGPSTFRFGVFDASGNPVPGIKVVFWWPDAPACPGAGYEEHGVVGETKETGYADFAMGGGAYYFVDQGQIGPHKAWIYGAGSDQVGGIGMLGGTEHNHFDVKVQPETEEPQPTTYKLTVSITGTGSVTVSPLQPVYNSGTIVTLNAVSADGWHFAGWGGALTGTTNPVTVTMDGDKAVTAVFVADDGGETVEQLIAEARALLAQADAKLVQALGML